MGIFDQRDPDTKYESTVNKIRKLVEDEIVPYVTSDKMSLYTPSTVARNGINYEYIGPVSGVVSSSNRPNSIRTNPYTQMKTLLDQETRRKTKASADKINNLGSETIKYGCGNPQKEILLSEVIRTLLPTTLLLREFDASLARIDYQIKLLYGRSEKDVIPVLNDIRDHLGKARNHIIEYAYERPEAKIKINKELESARGVFNREHSKLATLRQGLAKGLESDETSSIQLCEKSFEALSTAQQNLESSHEKRRGETQSVTSDEDLTGDSIDLR
jgi:hypothetical protein